MLNIIPLLTSTDLLGLWQQQGLLRAIDLKLARLLQRNGSTETLAILAALVSYQLGRGHTCLSLVALLDDPAKTLGLDESQVEVCSQLVQHLTDLAQITAELNAADAVRRLDQTNSPDALQPLVWDPQRQLLFLRRYWQYEHRIATWLQQRTVAMTSQLDVTALHAVIAQLVESKSQGISWQRVACANAARHLFSVITGGPGTGKTYTVVRVLATLLAFSSQLRIALAAPTGKAAARMDESVNNALAQTNNPALLRVKDALSRKASTLHRLLGSQRDSRYFRHHRAQPLPYDVVVVDEASMIDTEMFDALLDAIGPDTRLILLGDKDQLAPVEAGSILASICREAELRHYSAPHRQWLAQASGETLDTSTQSIAAGLQDHIVLLEGSERFKGAIADIALAVNACNLPATELALQQIRQLRLPNTSSEQDTKALWQTLASGFAPFIVACHEAVSPDDAAINQWAGRVLACYTNYQLLTALRAGPWGQQQVNQQLEQLLRTASGSWYHGRPVMVTNNDYSLNLNNGDIGIVLRHPVDQKLRVVFAAPVSDSNPFGVRWILPSRLTAVETVYAMTVHKSQGSEFRHAVLILPDRPTPVLTKELIYTGITRAKAELTLVIPNQQVWKQGILSRIERLGGLG